MRIPKWGLPFLNILYLKSYCEKTFVRFGEYYIALRELRRNLFTSNIPKQHLDLALLPIGHYASKKFYCTGPDFFLGKNKFIPIVPIKSLHFSSRDTSSKSDVLDLFYL